MTARHRILVVEDDPENARVMREQVGSMDGECRVATTLDEFRAAFAAWRPCAVVQDMQLPHEAGAKPSDKVGESCIKIARKASRGPRRVVVIVVTAFRSDPDFVWKMAELEADGFVEKARIEAMADKLGAALVKNGRAEHAECERCNQESAGEIAPTPTAAPARDAGVRVVVDGVQEKRNTGFLVNGQRCWLQDSKFVPFLRLVVAHLRAPGSWTTRTALGMSRDRWVPSRIRDAVKAAVPDGFEVVESDGSGRCRLNAGVQIESVDWKMLEGHSEAAVGKIAREQLEERI